MERSGTRASLSPGHSSASMRRPVRGTVDVERAVLRRSPSRRIPVVNHEPPRQPAGYEPFFGFHTAPFSLAPDTRFRFQSASHGEALAQITYALERREPIVVVQ